MLGAITINRSIAIPRWREDIHGRIVSYKGVRIMGFEGSQICTREAVQYTEREMYWKYQMMRFRLWRLGS